jgi:hypothetical protein
MTLHAAIQNVRFYLRDMEHACQFGDDQLVATAPLVPPDGGSPSSITISDLRSILERHPNDRWNIEEDGAALLVCRGEHAKAAGCSFERYVPESQPTTDLAARFEAEREQYWLDEAQRLAALVTALGGNPEPGAVQPVDPAGQERRRTPNAEFPDGVMDHTRRRLEYISALFEANGQPDIGHIAFLLRLGRSYVSMPKVDDLARERMEICRALGCVDKPGVPLEFVKRQLENYAEVWARNTQLIRSWDPATLTERQELDRMRRGWGPSSPTERNRRHRDVKACLAVLSSAMMDVTFADEDAIEMPEEAQQRLDEAYNRLDKQHTEMLIISKALDEEPMEWPDIRAAEERGAMAMRRILEEYVSGLRIRTETCAAHRYENAGITRACFAVRDAPLPHYYYGSALDDVAEILATREEDDESGAMRARHERDAWKKNAAKSADTADSLAKALWQARSALQPFAALAQSTDVMTNRGCSIKDAPDEALACGISVPVGTLRAAAAAMPGATQ